MNKSISRRISTYLVIFTFVILGSIGVGIRYFLPDYYKSYQLDQLNIYKEQLRNDYKELSTDSIIGLLEEAKEHVGGEIYFYSIETQGMGSGKGRNSFLNSKNENFKPEGDFTSYNYENKVGIDVHVIGVKNDDEYLVYEVGIQSLDNAVLVMVKFVWILLLIVLVFAFVTSLIISRKISQPIKELNELAKLMKSKQADARMVTKQSDEIGELNVSLNTLYEELLSNIYHLESELMKERNSEALKKRFLAQTTHELKTPISIIKGYSEILNDGLYKDKSEMEYYVKSIYDETETISTLILDVLDYTKMETGNYELELHEVDQSFFINSILRKMDDYIKSNGLESDIKYSSTDQLLKIDEKRIEQVIKNLVSNAVEHANSFIQISVNMHGDKLNFQIFNDGDSISDEDLPYIFDSFYKSSKKKTGTGLGLAIVKEIINLHNGSYRVENTKNGVKFTVTF